MAFLFYSLGFTSGITRGKPTETLAASAVDPTGSLEFFDLEYSQMLEHNKTCPNADLHRVVFYKRHGLR